MFFVVVIEMLRTQKKQITSLMVAHQPQQLLRLFDDIHCNRCLFVCGKLTASFFILARVRFGSKKPDVFHSENDLKRPSIAHLAR